MPNLQNKIEQRLQNLIVNRDRELTDLIEDLGYEYDNESYLFITSQWTENQKDIVNNITRIGYYDDDFHIFWVQLKNTKLNKSDQRTVINLINRKFPYNLCIFSNNDDTIWDFVNIKAVKSEESDDDKEPKKRQYLRRIRIDQGERLRTAVERISLLKVPEAGIHHFELQQRHDDAFDVEAVTDQFFDDFTKVFSNFRKHLAELSNDEDWAHAYGLQFFNRLIFVYFIQKKRWLGDDSEFIQSYWETYLKAQQIENSFAEKWLGVLFFDAFNKKAFYRKEWLPEKFDTILKNAPFLNGGLFKKTDLDNHQSVQIHDNEFKKVFDFLQSYNFTITEDSPIDQEVAVDPEMIGKIFETMAFSGGDLDKAHSHGIVYTHRTEITLMCRLALVDRFCNEFGNKHKNLFYELLFAFTEEDKNIVDQLVSAQNLWPDIGIFLEQITILDPAVGSGSFLVGMLNILADLKMRANSQLGVQNTIYKVKKNIVGRSLYGVDIMEWAVHVCELRLWLQLVVETELKIEERTIEPLLPNLDLNVRTGDSLVQMVGDVNFSHLHLTNLPSAIKGKLTTLKGEKRKYFYNDPTRKYKSKRQVDNAELNIFKEILDQQIHKRREDLKRMDRIIVGTEVEQKGIFGDEPKQESLKLKKTNAKEKQKLQDELLQFQTARNSLKDRKGIPFVWDISFAEIFSEDKHGFDIVIGNPPYVRQELIADPKENPDDFGGETATAWKTAKKAYKCKLMESVYANYPGFFHFDKKKQKHLRKLDAKNDLYVYFYLHGLSLLNSKGSFCFVTSNSWLDVGYGRDLQEFLLKKAPVKLIMDNQVKRSFKSADVNTVICLFGVPNTDTVIARSGATKQSPKPKFVMFYIPFEECLDPILFEEIDEATDRKTTQEYRVVEKDIAELTEAGTNKTKKDSIVSYTGDKWGGKYLRAPDIYYTILEKGKDKLVRLGDIAEVRFGIKTGANEFFYLTQEKIDEWGIEEEFLKPVIKSPRECKTIQIDPSNLKYKIFMCHKSKDELKGTNALKYIEWGENKKYNLKPTCASRSQWWTCPDFSSKIFMQMSYNDKFRFWWFNDDIRCDARLYNIYKIGLNECISLNSTFSVMCIELFGRANLGEGALDFKVYEADEIRIIKDDFSSRLGNSNRLFYRIINDIFTECGFIKSQPIRSQEPNPLPDRKALDDIVFDAIGLTPAERKEVYWAVCELVQRRLQKAKSV